MRPGSTALTLLLLALPLSADQHEIELGVESFGYKTTTTALNRDNVLGLDETEGLLRAALGVKESHGGLKLVARGYVERSVGGTGDRTDWTLRQGYAQYSWGDGATLKVGKQRAAWGSGFAWNPTNRLESPKNPLNTSLEREGVLAARLDVVPSAWSSITLIATKTESGVTDLPFGAAPVERRTAAVRARFLFSDTDLAIVASGGKDAHTLVGLDASRSLGGITTHVEGSLYRGSEILPRRDELFVRVVAGLLHTSGNTSLTAEYFFNQEGYDDQGAADYLAGLDASYAVATDARLPPAARDAALTRYLAGALMPYAAGLGLRRHYVQASWSKAEIAGKWTANLRGAFGLSDGAIALTPGVVFAPRGNLTLSLDAIVLLGPESSEYRLAPLRSALQIRARLLL